MTAANQSPEGEDTSGTRIAATDPGQAEATGTEGDPQVDGSSGSPGTGSEDYESRLAQGGEFAIQEVKNWQRKAGTANSRLDQYKPLERYIEEVGGASVLSQHVQLWNRLIQDPEGRRIVESFAREGSVRPVSQDAGGSDGDDWEDPAEKKIRLLESELANIKGRVLKTDRSTQQSRLTTMFETVMNEFPGMAQEARQKAFEGAKAEIVQWSTTPEGLDTLSQLDESGARAMLYRHLTAQDLKEAAYNERQSTQDSRRELATHERSGTTTGGGGDPQAMTALDALRIAARRNNVDL